MNVLISACLLGINCKYNGGNNLTPKLLELLKEHTLIPVCPEQLGGLTTPRKPSEIKQGDGSMVLAGKAEVKNNEGVVLTELFIKGAQETLKLAKLYQCTAAILKARSPSCGSGKIYDGTFSGAVKEGSGVAAQLLMDNGIIVMTEEDFEEKLKGM